MQQKFIFLVIFLFGVTNILGQNAASLLTKCWEFQSELMANRRIASDNTTTIFIYQNDSTITSIDKLGKTIWSNDTGGNLISDITVGNNKIYYAVRVEEKVNSFVIRSSSSQTGLTIWERKLETDYSVETVEVVIDSDSLLIISDKQSLYFLNSNDGKLISSARINSGVISNIITDSEKIYFVNEKNSLISYSPKIEANSIFLELDKPTNKIYLTKKEKLLTVNSLGQLSQFDKLTRKKEWTFRAGGNLNLIEEFNDYYLITSLDNYIYCVSAKSGKLLWRRRMDGRTNTILAKKQSQFISTLVNGQQTLLLELKKGRTVNQINLSGNSFFINEPFILNDLLILSTNKGLIAYSFAGC